MMKLKIVLDILSKRSKIMNEFWIFYNDIIKRKRFFLPVSFFVIIGYSFAIFNRTISIDDLLINHSLTNGEMISGRWGMFVWFQLLGLTEQMPFIYRFLSMLFVVASAVLFCFVLYSIGGKKDVLPYTATASAFVTYPLINEIWEYVVDYVVVGNLCLVSLSAIVMRMKIPLMKRLFWGSVFMVLPMASYESAIFYYISLVCIIAFYESTLDANKTDNFRRFKKYLYFIVPVIVAFVVRFTISIIINTLYDLQYNSGGNTQIVWQKYDFVPTLKGLVVSNLLHYFVYGLVYLPITVFALSLLFLIFYNISLKNKRLLCMFLSVILIASLFLQAVVQGDLLQYRHAQTISLFVAFIAYLSCVSIKGYWQNCLYVFLFGLCWHQAIFMNKISALNNLRSDNDLSVIRQLGKRIISQYEKKPVVFVGEDPELPYWIRRQVTVNESSWNGRLFRRIMIALDGSCDLNMKYVGTNVNPVMPEYLQLQDLFSYCGYDITVVPDYFSGDKTANMDNIRKEAAYIADRRGLGPYQIIDNGKYLIVNLGGQMKGDTEFLK